MKSTLSEFETLKGFCKYFNFVIAESYKTNGIPA